MKINFDLPVKTLDGIAMLDEDGKVFPISKACQNALLVPVQAQDGSEKVKAYQLALKCKGKADLTSDEVVLLKKKLGENAVPLVAGQLINMIDELEKK